MWPTRGERAQTPSSHPPCAPSLEAQRLPPKSPLLRWTVPDLGDAGGGGGGAATALRSQSSSKQRQCHRRPEPTRDGWLPPRPHSLATERGARTSRLRLGWSAQVLRCLRLGPPKGCPQQEPQPGRASPSTLDWAGEPAGGGAPLRTAGPPRASRMPSAPAVPVQLRVCPGARASAPAPRRTLAPGHACPRLPRHYRSRCRRGRGGQAAEGPVTRPPPEPTGRPRLYTGPEKRMALLGLNSVKT